MKANVDEVDVFLPVACAAGIRSSREEVEDESIEPVGGVPIGSHALPVCLATLGCRLTLQVDKPEEEVDKDDIRLAKAPLLEQSMHLG